MTELQLQVVYNVFSFANYKRMATHVSLWMRVSAVNVHYQSAVHLNVLSFATRADGYQFVPLDAYLGSERPVPKCCSQTRRSHSRSL